MTISTSRAAYEDCFSLLDQALSSTKGIRTSASDSGSANNLYTRLHYARTLSRNESREVYSPDAPEFGISPYDGLIVRRPQQQDGAWWVHIEPRRITGKVEEL